MIRKKSLGSVRRATQVKLHFPKRDAQFYRTLYHKWATVNGPTTMTSTRFWHPAVLVKKQEFGWGVQSRRLI